MWNYNENILIEKDWEKVGLSIYVSARENERGLKVQEKKIIN